MAKPEPKRISELDLAGPLTGAEQMVFVQNERTVRGSLDSLSDFVDRSCQCTLVSRFETTCTSAVTFEEFLETYTLPANTLPTAGSYLDVFAKGTMAATATTKTVTFTIGSSTYSFPTAVYNDYVWFLYVKIQRVLSNSFRISGKWEIFPNSAALQTPEVLRINATEEGENLLIDQPMSISAENGTANANDICVESWIVDLHLLDADS